MSRSMTKMEDPAALNEPLFPVKDVVVVVPLVLLLLVVVGAAVPLSAARVPFVSCPPLVSVLFSVVVVVVFAAAGVVVFSPAGIAALAFKAALFMDGGWVGPGGGGEIWP